MTDWSRTTISINSFCCLSEKRTAQLCNAREHPCDEAIVVLVDWLSGRLALSQRLNTCIGAIRVGNGALQRYGHKPQDGEGETKPYKEDSSMNMEY